MGGPAGRIPLLRPRQPGLRPVRPAGSRVRDDSRTGTAATVRQHQLPPADGRARPDPLRLELLPELRGRKTEGGRGAMKITDVAIKRVRGPFTGPRFPFGGGQITPSALYPFPQAPPPNATGERKIGELGAGYVEIRT